MDKKSALGKNLANLGLHELLENLEDKSSKDFIYSDLPIDNLYPSAYQPRTYISDDSLQELAASIAEQGILQPIIVRPTSDMSYEIIAGERRWRAAKIAGLQLVPAIIRRISNEQAMAIALIENIQRADLNPLDQAKSLNKLYLDFNMTHDSIAKIIGKSRASITNILRLLELHPKVQDLLSNNDIDMGHARALLALDGDLQVELAKSISVKKLSVRETERMVKSLLSRENKSDSILPDWHIGLLKLGDDLTHNLKLKVDIVPTSYDKGKITLRYSNSSQLSAILDYLSKIAID